LPRKVAKEAPSVSTALRTEVSIGSLNVTEISVSTITSTSSWP
jgi:hypothetical protein